MIRLLHTSDWHLGRHLFGRSLLEDQAFALSELIKLVRSRKPHGLLIAGDVFDRSLPPEDAVILLNRFLTELIHETETPVFLIPGNHDSKERLGFASSLLRNQRLHIFSQVKDAFHPALVRGDGDGDSDSNTEALIYGIPFVEPAEIAYALSPDLLGTELARSHDLALKEMCERIRLQHQAGPHASSPAILLCHEFVMGGEISESEKEIAIGGSSQVSAQAFDGFAYTALGHLHKAQSMNHGKVRYSGSLLKYSKSEIAHEKSVTEIVLGRGDKPELVFHRLPLLRDLRYIEGKIDELITNAAHDGRRDDYILVGLTDQGAVLDSFAKLRKVYPNLLHVGRAGGFTPDALPAASRARREQSELDLFSDFFKSATGTELSDDERATLVEALMNARLNEEA
jgi:exonuclease SbcD